MKMNSRYGLINTIKILIIIFLSINTVQAQVPANINTSNPAIPFPQFLDYVNSTTTLKTLASQNSSGVPHAELEQRIRDAYQILCNNLSYEGNAVAGVKYIFQNPTIGGANACAEAYGYYLLAAAVMGDKPTYDGLFMFVHDNSFHNTKRYIDGVVNPAYLYNTGLCGAGNASSPTGVTGAASNTGASATDGDDEIGLAAVIAWKQWGNLSGITPPATGIQISYKTEALNYITKMVDTFKVAANGKYTSGDVGFDGYISGGDTWQAMMTWANPGYLGMVPDYPGATPEHIDYCAPAYYNCFANVLAANGGTAFVVNQFKRAEASSDWLMGQMNSQGLIPSAGWVDMSSGTPAFSTFNQGEDFRAAWRTILNYVWNGNPATTWNPVTHQLVAGGNTYEHDLALSFAALLKAPEVKGGCDTYAAPVISFGGVPTIKMSYSPAGVPSSTFTLNWFQGTGAPAAVAAQDFDLMSQMFRQNVIEWDGTAGYLTSNPVYFHEFFRLLGMLVLTGNMQSPVNMIPTSNMKIYKSVDKTFAYIGDTLTYKLVTRNYGSLAATGVIINDPVPAGFTFLSATSGGTLSGGNVKWNLGVVPGFVSGGLASTIDTVIVKFIVNNSATGRICNIAMVASTNGTGWTSNEYPNNITEVMQRNCVDIVQRPLYINKTANVKQANPGGVVNYTLDFGNQSVPFLNGGRPNVTVAFGNNGTPASSNQLGLKIRLYHGADEAYINYKNYRISYFLQDPNTSWVLSNTIYEGGLATGVTVTQQNLNPGTSAQGAWNQRMIVQFADQLATTTPHLLRYSGLTSRIHEGGTMMLRAVWNMHDAGFANHNWLDDWSADNAASAADGDPYFPITNDWTDPNNLNIPVTKLHRNACTNASHTVNNIMVEEWDSYTWRRVLGNGPVSGRDVSNVVVQDVLPTGVTFGGFTNATTLGVTAVYNAGTRTITLTIPLMRINDVGELKYWVTVNSAASFGGCPINTNQINVSSISGTNESPAYSRDTVAITCNPLPPPPPPPSNLNKTVTSGVGPYSVGSPVSYSLSYTNTTGSTAQPDLNSATNWALQSGSGNFNFASGKLTTVNNQNAVMTYGYSHGTDGTLTGTINATASATVGIAMRHTGGAMANGVYVTFNQNPGAGTIVIAFWNGTTEVSSASYALAAGAFTYQIVLSGGTISVWLNNFSGTPLASQTGMTVQAGYAGVINGDPSGANAWAANQVTSFTTNLDSAFNIQMYDPIPSNITYVSSSNSGTVTASTLTWPITNNTTTTPLLAGATVTRTWTGTVNSCAGGFISNTGFIKILGITPDPGGQVNVSCTVAAPVSWLYFNAVNTSSGNLLTWSTAMETNNKQFIIERSEDGIHFNKINFIAGAGNSNVVKEYSYNDNSYTSALSYYRITQVDYDGKSSISNVVAVSTGNTFAVLYYPNPFTSTTTLIVKSNTPTARLTLSSVLGVELLVRSIETNKEISIGDNLASGTYILYVESEAGNDRIRLVKNE